jgi:hypothetical protein
MRIITALMAATLLALPACKDDTTVADEFQEIGRFTVTVDGEDKEYITYLNTESGSSGINKIPAGTMSVWIVTGYGGVQDGSPALPELSVTILQTGNALKLDNIELISETAKQHYLSNAETGKLVLSDAGLADDGKIGFGISADMLLVDMSSNSPVPVSGVPSIHIEGHYNGTLPAQPG